MKNHVVDIKYNAYMVEVSKIRMNLLPQGLLHVSYV